MRIIVGGSRSFDDYPLLKKTLNALTFKLNSVEIVSGHAEGTDQLGERWAEENYYTYHIFRPDYNKHKSNPKVAPLMRNTEMAEFADAAVLFWDGRSRGTKDMIDKAKKHKLKLKIIRF